MSIRIAIHGRGGYAERWLDYCLEHDIDHEVVDCYDSDIIARLGDFDGLLWHFAHRFPDLLVARHVLMSAEQMGLAVFPDTPTSWHFDDKVAQKYLLEAAGAPLVPTYVFYDKAKALEWLEHAELPLVRKLRRGAGSLNVRLLRSKQEAVRFCKRMFGGGMMSMPDAFSDPKRRVKQMSHNSELFWRRVKAIPRHLMKTRNIQRITPREKGYVYFQKFVPNNQHDIRVTTVGNRAYGFRREVRPGDFRASGSGQVSVDPADIPMECVKIAFDLSDKLGVQTMAYDFLTGGDGKPLITEMCLGCGLSCVFKTEGYWTKDFIWHTPHLWPEHAILEDFLELLQKRKAAGHVPAGNPKSD